MPTPPIYRMFLKRKGAGNYYQYTGGVVTETSVKTPIRDIPKGWDKTEVEFTRHMDYLGLFRSIGIDYNFHGDAQAILRYVKYTQSTEGDCSLLIEKLVFEDYSYEYFHEAAVNFVSSTDADTFFTAILREDGVLATLTAKGKSTYQLSCNSADELRVKLDGISLYGTYHFVPENTAGTAIPAASSRVAIYGSLFYVHTTDDGDFPVALPGDQYSFNYLPINGLDTIGSTWPDSYLQSGYGLLAPKQGMEVGVSINGDFAILIHSGGSGTGQYVQFDAFVIDSTQKVVSIIPIATSPSVPGGTPGGSAFPFSINTETSPVTVSSGSRIYFTARMYNNHPSDALATYANADLADTAPLYFLDIKVKFRLSETATPAIKFADAFDRMMKMVFDTTSSVSYSSFLRRTDPVEDNVPYYTYLAPGDAIRGFDTAFIKASANDLIDHARKSWMLGLGTDNIGRVVLEDLRTFFDSTNMIADLGYVTDAEFSVADDYMYNETNVGMDNQTYDSLNGRDEYNQKANFRAPLTSVTKTLDLLSPFRFDMYGIETYRANLSQKKTTDSDSDNDTFVLSAAPDSAFEDKLRRPVDYGGYITGVLDPATAYNVDLGYAATMRRNYPLLAVSCHLQSGKVIAFGSTDKNAEMAYQMTPSRPLIVSKADIPVDSLGTPLFLPINCNFTSKVPLNIPKLLKDNPYGYFKITCTRGTFKVFMMKVGLTPSRNSVYKWQTVLSPDNDLTQLY